MRGKEQNRQGIWNEVSFRKYNLNGRKYWYEEEVFDREYDNVLSYGLLEDLTLTCCYGIEDIWEIIKEFN